MTPTIDSAIPLAGAADPTALTNSPRAGMSFADICAAQLSQAPETQTHIAAEVPASPSNSSAPTANTPTPSNAPPAKSSAKNVPGSNPALAFFVPLSLIAPSIQWDPLSSSPMLPAKSLASGDSTNQSGGFDGANQIPSLPPVAGTTTAAASTPNSTNVLTVAAPIPGFAPTVNLAPEIPAPASCPTDDRWPLSPPIETNPTPSLLPNLVGAQAPTLKNIPTIGPNDPKSPDTVSAASESVETTAQRPSQAPAMTFASENSAFSPDVQLPVPGDVAQPIPSQVLAAQVSVAAADMPALQDADPQSAIQSAATPSAQTEQPVPSEQKAPQPSAMRSRPPLDQEMVSATLASGTAATKTIAASSNATTSLASHAALPEAQPAASAVARASSNRVPASSSASNPQNIPTAENNLAVPAKSNPPSHPLGNAQASTGSSQDSAPSPASTSPVSSSEASSSKKDSGGNASDFDQSKNSSNGGVAAANCLPTIPPTASTIAPQSAPINISQPSSLPDSAAKSIQQTPAGAPDNVPRSSLPAAADAPPPASTSPLQWAHIANKVGQAEMRIGLSTAEFGGVEVRTSVHASDVGVQIGSEKGDLRSLLTPELPSIANTLQQHDLRLAQVSFHQQGFSFTGNSSFSGGNPQPRSFARPQTTAIFSEELSATESAQPVLNPGGTGLSILA